MNLYRKLFPLRHRINLKILELKFQIADNEMKMGKLKKELHYLQVIPLQIANDKLKDKIELLKSLLK